MQSISDIASRLTELISGSLGNERVYRAFESGAHGRIPVKRTTVTVGIKSVELSGESSAAGADSATLLVTADIKICVPKAGSGEVALYVLDRILTALLEASGSGLEVVGLSSSPIAYSTALGALVLPAEITVRAA